MGFSSPVVVCCLESVVVLRGICVPGGPPSAVLVRDRIPTGVHSVVCGVTARTDNANPVKTLTIRAESVGAEDVPGRRVPRPVGSAELSGFGGAFQCGGRRVRVDRGRDQV